MKRYYALNDKDLIEGNHYECVCTVGNNNIHRTMNVYYDKLGFWALRDNEYIVSVVDNSIMIVLKRKNKKRFDEIVAGGFYQDEETAESSYSDCEID